MNLRERLAQLLKELDGATTKEEIDRIKGEIVSVKAKIAAAEAAGNPLDAMKAGAPVFANGSSARTLGQQAVDAMKAKGVTERGTRFDVTTKPDSKTAGDPQLRPTGYMPAITEVRPDVLEGARRPMTVADLFAQETTDKAAVTYYVEGAVQGEITTVGEGQAYPLLTFGDPTAVTDPLKKIGCVYKDSDELIEDAPRLKQSIDNRAEYLMDIKEEDQLLSGNGQGNNITGLLNRSGLQLATATSIEAALDAIKTAKAGIRKNTPGFRADGLLVNDEDWDALTSIKDNNKQYLAGGPFYGAYGSNNGPVDEPPLWGLRVVPTQAIAKGTMVIGAFKLGGSVIRKGGRVIDITNSDGTDFENGLVAFRPSERLALAVRYPAAFVKLSIVPATDDDTQTSGSENAGTDK